MPKEFNQISSERTFEFKKQQTFAPWEINSANFFVPKKADIFTPLRYEKISSIFKPMAEGSAEIGIPPVKTEALQPHDPRTEARKVVEATEHQPLDEEKLHKEQDEAGENLEELLAELRAEGELDFEIMNHDELEEALGLTLTNEHHGSMKHVYDIAGRPDVVAKVDRSLVSPEDQDMEKDINQFLHRLAPDNIPETLETWQKELNGKKASGTYTKKAAIAPEGTHAVPGKTIKDMKAMFEEVGLHRFMDTNVGNGVEDGDTHDVDAKTRAEIYYDDSGDLIISDILQSRGKVERFVDNNLGTRYSEEAGKGIKDFLGHLQDKYDPEYKKNPEYKAQKENQKKLIAA